MAYRPRKKSQNTVTLTCETCDTSFEVYNSAVKRRNFCSVACYQGRQTGRPATPGKKVTLTCDNCDTTFERYKSHMKKGNRRGNFCSHACYQESRKETRHCTVCGTPFEVYKRKNKHTCSDKCAHTSGMSGETVQCAYCGADIYRHSYRVERHEVFFCDKSCQYNHLWQNQWKHKRKDNSDA